MLLFHASTDVPIMVANVDARVEEAAAAAVAQRQQAATPSSSSSSSYSSSSSRDNEGRDANKSSEASSRKAAASASKASASSASAAAVSTTAAAPTRRDWSGAFGAWLASLGCVVLFIFLHQENFPLTDGWSLYTCLLCGVMAPWFLLCVRRWIELPDTPFTRTYVIAFDVCVAKTFVRNNALLMLLSVLGFTNTEFFSLLLLDVLNILPLLGAVTRAITVPHRELLAVLYLFVVTTVVYAHFGLRHYEDLFQPECHGVTSCFFSLMYNAAPSGDVDKVLALQDNRQSNGKPELLLRIMYVLPYFVWCGTLLKSIISGLMISTFGKLRRAMAGRMDTLNNEAFVCGITRAEFGDLNLPGNPKFDDLNAREQNPWNYVFFYYYLHKKPSINYTGVESYIRECLDRNEWLWLPNNTSFRIQTARAAVELEAGLDPTTGMLEAIGAGISQMKAGLRELRERLVEFEDGGEEKQ
jgi:hypothetical protein